MVERTLFIDTNILLQFKDLRDIPWHELGAGDYLLVIPRAVIAELDKLKSQGNNRRAGRSRLALQLVREVRRASQRRVTLRAAGATVTCTVSDSTIEAASGDAAIVAEALEWKSKHPASDILLLTDDQGPAIAADDRGLPCVEPLEAWRLPPEPDEREKRISALERRLSALESKQPSIVIAFMHEGTPVEGATLEVKITSFALLSPDQVDQLVSEAISRNPMATDFGSHRLPPPMLPYGQSLVFPTAKDIEQYREDYKLWSEEIKAFFTRLPDELSASKCRIVLEVSVSNAGNVPASRLEVRFDTERGLLLPPEDVHEDERPGPSLPAPPIAPKPRVVNKDFLASKPLNLVTPIFPHIPHQEEPGVFCWKDGPPSLPLVSHCYQCSEFSHHQEPEIFEVLIGALDPRVPSAITLRCKVVASNLVDAVRRDLTLLVKPDVLDAFEYAKNLVHPESVVTLRLPSVSEADKSKSE